MKSRIKQIAVEFYTFREVIGNLIAAHLAIKYRRTYFGYFWSVLNPILQLTVLSVVFSHVVKWEMKHYVAYLFSGVLTWNFFANSVQVGSGSFIEAEPFIKKVYLPKIIFPFCRVAVSLVDFLSALIAFILIVTVLGIPLHATLLLLPAALFSLFLFSFGVVILFSVATVYFRDLLYLVNVGLQILYFATPIIYPIDMLPAHYQQWLRLNPLTTQVQLFQNLIYYGRVPSGSEWALAYGVAFGFLGLGILILKKLEEEIVFRL